MEELTGQQVRNLNNQSAVDKDASTGSVLNSILQEIGAAEISGVDISVPIVITYEVTADATSGLSIFDANCPYPLVIDDVTIESRATSGSGTLKLTDGTNDITDAIICAVDGAVTRAGTIDDTYSTIALNGTLKVIANGGTDRGKVSITIRRVN